MIAVVRSRFPRATRRPIGVSLISVIGRRIARYVGIRPPIGMIGMVALRALLEARAFDVARHLEAIARVLVLPARTPVTAAAIVARWRRGPGVAEALAACLGGLFL